VIIAVDVGNTKTEIASVVAGEVIDRHRVTTGSGVESALRQVALGKVTGLAVGTVVPGERARWAAIGAAEGWATRVFARGDEVPIATRVREPARVGVDRLVNAIGALDRARGPLVVVDIGTATTVDAIDGDGVFLGGAILAGPATALRALVGGTAQLPPVPLAPPPAVIGRDTVEAIQSGCVLGYAGAIDALVAGMREAIGAHATAFFCGGLGASFAPLCRGPLVLDDTLTLRGLARAWELSR